MRSVTAYYLLLLYLTVMFKPLLPVIGDVAAHFFAGAYHEATVHARYGEHHLDAEIVATDTGNDKGREQNTVKTGDTVPVHLYCAPLSYLFSLNGTDPVYLVHDDCQLAVVVISDPSPPPRAA